MRLALATTLLLAAAIGAPAIGLSTAIAEEGMKVARGGELARQLCSECHVVDGAGGGSDAVPTFHAIANRDGMTDELVRGFIYAPHPQMPSLQIPREEVDALVAYIRSLEE